MAVLEIQEQDGSVRRVPLKEGKTLVGRAEDAAVRLTDATVSHVHAMVLSGDDGFRVFDLGSRNGIHINERETKTAVLRDGDRIRIGQVTLTFRDTAGAGAAAGVVPLWIRDAPWWALSAALHLIIVLLVGAYVKPRREQSESPE